MYSKVMLRAFSTAPEDSQFQTDLSTGIEKAKQEGTASVKVEGETDLDLTKTDEGIEIKDNINGETTIATENPDNGEVQLEAKEKVEETKTEGEDCATIVKKGEDEFEVKTKDESFSVKGSFAQAMKLAKTFSDKVEVDLTAVGDNMEPSKEVPASTGIADPEKAGTPAARKFGLKEDDIAGNNEGTKAEPQVKVDKEDVIVDPVKAGDATVTSFAEKLEEAEKTVEETGESVELPTENPDETVMIEKAECGDKKFSYQLINRKQKSFSETTREELLGEPKPEEEKSAEEVLAEAERKVESKGEPVTVTADDNGEQIVVDKGEGEKKFSYFRVNLKDKSFTEISREQIFSDEDPEPEEAPKEKTAEEIVAEAEKSVDETGESVTVTSNENGEQVLIEKAEGEKKFSYFRIDKKNKSFSEISREDIFKEPEAPKPEEDPLKKEGEEYTPTEDEARSFSACLTAGPKRVFATKEQIEGAQKTFSDPNNGGGNPLLHVKF